MGTDQPLLSWRRRPTTQQTAIGTLGVRTIIDGQKRLTTLQLLLDTAHECLKLAGLDNLAQQMLDLVRNPSHFAAPKRTGSRCADQQSERVGAAYQKGPALGPLTLAARKQGLFAVHDERLTRTIENDI